MTADWIISCIFMLYTRRFLRLWLPERSVCIGSYLISFLSVILSKPITDSTVNMPIGVSYDISSCTGLGTMLDWNGRYKLMAGVRTGAGAPNTLLPEGPDPCRGPQYLGLWDTMCEADARGGVQTLLTVHKYKWKRNFSLWKL